MCFKRKKKEIINSRFKMGELVNFRYKDELTFGFIYKIKEDKDGSILYDIQIGGQCPAILYDIPEKGIWTRK